MSIPLRSEALSDPTNASLLSHAFDGTAQTALLLRTAGIRDSDDVVVIGRKTLDHLIALNRLNCRSVIAINPDRPLPRIAKADVIWVTDGVKADISLLPLISDAEWLRAIVIDQADTGAASDLHLLLKELRFRGFTHEVSHGAGGHTSVIASRPAWLRRIV
jgi:hypothetical protein